MGNIDHKCPNCERLEKRVAQLEILVARLSKNSRTSSKPPSSDIVKPRCERRQKGKRKIGGQPGHKKHDRVPFSEAEIDEHHELEAPEQCPDCGDKLVKPEDSESLTQQSITLPKKPFIVHEIKRSPGFCRNCGKAHYEKLPVGFAEKQLLGIDFQAMIAYQKSVCHTSYTGIRKFIKNVFKLNLSRGHLAEVVARVSRSLKAPYDELRGELSVADFLNIDETGWKENKDRRWLWVFCNRFFSFFKLSESRGSKVLKEILGEIFDGAIISDFFGAYKKYGNKKQQFCLAHFIRDIKYLTTLPNRKSKKFGKELLEHFKRLFELWHNRKNISKRKFRRQAEDIVFDIVGSTWHEDLPKEAQLVADRIENHGESYFRFLEQNNLEPTNNEAERALRAPVIDRRMTQGSRSPKGLTWTERIWTVIDTCAKQSRSSFDFLKQALLAYHQNRAAPSLIPQ